MGGLHGTVEQKTGAVRCRTGQNFTSWMDNIFFAYRAWKGERYIPGTEGSVFAVIVF